MYPFHISYSMDGVHQTACTVANTVGVDKKKGIRKVQGVPQSQTEALPRHQEEEETDKKNKCKSNKRTKSIKISSLFPKRGNRNAKRTENTRTK